MNALADALRTLLEEHNETEDRGPDFCHNCWREHAQKDHRADCPWVKARAALAVAADPAPFEHQPHCPCHPLNAMCICVEGV